ncbi:hypothetical protein AB4Z10_29585 [Bosea sp. RAF48]|jgi:hypothetical protein|uniref:hypothetical protein n=1 Tax=Bosea sp. RAF48 TaxID=3237480 RepID=UPI003F8E9670
MSPEPAPEPDLANEIECEINDLVAEHGSERPRYGQFCTISTFCSPTPIVPSRAGICAGCSHRERGLFANPNDQ